MSKVAPFVTPTFQMVLNKQIADIMDALNEGNVWRAFEIEKTLVSALKPKDRDYLENNGIKRVENLVRSARKPESSSFYRNLIQTSANHEAVLANNVRVLFRSIMETLWKGDYMEKAPLKPRFTKEKKLSALR